MGFHFLNQIFHKTHIASFLFSLALFQTDIEDNSKSAIEFKKHLNCQFVQYGLLQNSVYGLLQCVTHTLGFDTPDFLGTSLILSKNLRTKI